MKITFRSFPTCPLYWDLVHLPEWTFAESVFKRIFSNSVLKLLPYSNHTAQKPFWGNEMTTSFFGQVSRYRHSDVKIGAFRAHESSLLNKIF